MVLGLVEPQSSGIGGGAFMLYYDAASKKVTALTMAAKSAPAAATPDYLRYISDSDRTTPQPSARASGRSVGTPGAVRMLDLAHKDYGSKPWKDLMQPGIDLASNGFKISGRMADALAGAKTALQADADAVALYFNADGSTKALGSTFTNPAYAASLTRIASSGADAFYTGTIAARHLCQESAPPRSGTGAASPRRHHHGGFGQLPGQKARSGMHQLPRQIRDLRHAAAIRAAALRWRSAWVFLKFLTLAPHKPTAMDIEGGKPTAMGVHLVSEAERMAYADRDIKDYSNRAPPSSRPTTSMGTATAGQFGSTRLGVAPVQESGTTHLTIVDAKGNVVSMTTTVESGLMGLLTTSPQALC
ncbi:hypothetical protein FQA39_LY19324 [Lamprigera yunnana]|nr:hypothetical protein FQA39_LY19324 [Lamprigera yunnana]